jgi:hypothetical protein
MDTTHIPELTHKLRNIIGLRVLRKHGIINHAHGTGAEVKKIPNTGCSILKLHNSASAIFICPEINIV